MIVALYGCCSKSKDGFFVNPQGDEIITSREVIIDDLGRLPTVTFPSGTKIEGLEENTLTPGIVVTIVEQQLSPKNAAFFNKNSEAAGICIYKITAVQNSSNSLESKTYVTTTEKPIKVTFLNTTSSNGITLAGVKESDTDPWRLFNYSDSLGILQDIENLRLSKAATDNTFNIFRLGIQFALVIYEGNTGNRLPESYVSWLNASSTASIMVKEGKYLEDLTVKGILKGINLESIKPADLRARITYRNNKADEAPLKVNGVAVTQTNMADKTVPGYTYHHTFVVDRVSDSLLMNTSGEYTFILNLDGVETDFFSDGFLIEFYNKVDSEKILPYNYTEFYSVNKVESANLVLSAVDGSIADEAGNFFNLSPMFKITSSYEFSEADKKKIAKAITVSNVDSEKIKKGWEGRDLYISFAEDLQPDTLYTISMEEITDLENAVITPFDEFSFTTESDAPVIPIEFYNIDYMLYGGVTDPENPKTYSNSSETFTLVNPTKPGYTFIGWTGSNGDTPQMTVIIEQGSTGDRNYTANYAAVAYSITYNLDGGINSPENPDGFNTASESFTLTNPTKLGYEFIGWTGSNGNTPQMNVSIETGSTENRTYNANFRLINYSISYINIDGCNFASANPENYDVTSGTIEIANPTKNGYEFLGWTGTGLDAASMTLSIPIGSTENRSYSANFSLVSYSITYNNVENCTFISNNPTSYDITSATITLNEPTKTGLEFLGWTSEDITVPQKTGVQISQGSIGDKIFTANWNINLNLAIAPDDGMLIDDVNNLYYTKSSFTVTPTIPAGLVLSDSEKADIVAAIRVKDSASNSVNIATASWNNENIIALSFNDDLNASSTYSIAFDNMEGMTLNCATYSFKTFYYKGRGTNENRYQVENAAQLDLIRNYLNKHFLQTADIDIATYTWSAIAGRCDANLNPIPFTGSYYGNGKIVKNLKIRDNDTDSAFGFWGYVAKDDSDVYSGKIASMTIDGCSARSTDDVDVIGRDLGIFVFTLGENCSLENCCLTDSLNSGRLDLCTVDFGGICFTNYGTITNCSVKNCSVENYSSRDFCASIICLYNSGEISGCSVSDSIGILTECIAFSNSGTITNCSIKNCRFTHGCGINWSDGEISGCSVFDSNFFGNTSLVNSNEGTVTNCLVNNCNVYYGGICNNNSGEVSRCYVLNTTVTEVSDFGVGGICRYNENKVTSCYFYYDKDDTPPLTGYVKLGLLIGINENNNVSDCFTNKSEDLFGDNSGVVTNCYSEIDAYDKFSGKTWSDGAWDAYNVSNTNWPPDLKNNPRQ